MYTLACSSSSQTKKEKKKSTPPPLLPLFYLLPLSPHFSPPALHIYIDLNPLEDVNTFLCEVLVMPPVDKAACVCVRVSVESARSLWQTVWWPATDIYP